MQKDHRGVRSHPHEQHLADWETRLNAREARLEWREEVLADRDDREGGLLADADQRDVAADARDSSANRRDVAASLREFLNDPPDTEAHEARGAAALDRANARADRVASKGDRTQLTDDG